MNWIRKGLGGNSSMVDYSSCCCNENKYCMVMYKIGQQHERHEKSSSTVTPYPGRLHTSTKMCMNWRVSRGEE